MGILKKVCPGQSQAPVGYGVKIIDGTYSYKKVEKTYISGNIGYFHQLIKYDFQ